ncbi:proton-conducting membrane transporter [Mesorhizobium sp.]|uniref:proton-conducting membrane transporter n=1 Tax=Mesorhizobium sp. TaxID=1871066 RepID=UPI000FE64251|nr:proton-conducting membrane transporter [Mesorhizobium sp.]RWK31627.1 MAG: proton-conducting membrane transporter [Mesorhizobium sp.]RWK62691.1 MAG: proton-conducting membrane transporter [Mesorhizobium sp.]RWK79769.1 MAG: proton-conducting membrane transporter [Mesorhizobium sp.]RWK82547.1 MAG: proton-conducting membrane transporter [Mesorhizobium sp.]RWK99224.1 MAG: proton-conducting membrane transporter [Mesorhizobium sp.]
MATFFYMLLALLAGVLVGWFIWGRPRGELDSDMGRTRSERDRLRIDADRLTRELEACRGARADLERQLAEAQGAKTGATKAAIPAPPALMAAPAKPTPAKTGPAKSAPAKSGPAKTTSKKPATVKAAAAPKASASKASASKASASQASAPKPPASKAAPKSAAPAAKKAATAKAAADKASDLRRLIGIGPTNERLLHGLGVTTYAQIAAWTPADVKRIEETLNFDGRIERERWIEQAKLLAAGDEEEFARRFPTAGTGSNS